jgi:hypothetical protein
MTAEPEAAPRPHAHALRPFAALRERNPRADAKPQARPIARRAGRNFLHPPATLAQRVTRLVVADEQHAAPHSVLPADARTPARPRRESFSALHSRSSATGRFAADLPRADCLRRSRRRAATPTKQPSSWPASCSHVSRLVLLRLDRGCCPPALRRSRLRVREPGLAVPVPGIPQRRVRAAAGDQLLVRADLVEKALFDHGDPVGVVRRVQAMGDRDDGPPV